MIVWHNPAVLLPERLVDVLIAIRGEVEAREAFYMVDRWVTGTGHDIELAKVYAWTELPRPPAPAALSDFWKLEDQKA